jgi:hypothetical protein
VHLEAGVTVISTVANIGHFRWKDAHVEASHPAPRGCPVTSAIIYSGHVDKISRDLTDTLQSVGVAPGGPALCILLAPRGARPVKVANYMQLGEATCR